MEDTGYVVIFGGRSEIGVQVATRLAPGRTVVLAARRADELTAEVEAVRAAGAAEVHVCEFDADDIGSHTAVLRSIVDRHGASWSTAVLAFGVLGDQQRAELDAAHAAAIVHTDYVAQVSLLTALLALSARGPATKVTFSSIAGVRVRRANYVYGSAKAGLDGFCSGFAEYARVAHHKRLLVVRPGFVVGRMTEGMAAAPFSSTPAQVADATVRALAGRRRSVWVPWQVGLIAAVFRILPGPIWRRLPR